MNFTYISRQFLRLYTYYSQQGFMDYGSHLSSSRQDFTYSTVTHFSSRISQFADFPFTRIYHVFSSISIASNFSQSAVTLLCFYCFCLSGTGLYQQLLFSLCILHHHFDPFLSLCSQLTIT